ncbi:hypothetical protein EDC96DRAFT_613128 [Choanephora cucurbitarum]|nr:hypothetical protein EDC96DRAFT_613128 [Choanephora cucurbitarum]
MFLMQAEYTDLYMFVYKFITDIREYEYETETGFVNDVDVQDANLSDVSMEADFEGNGSASTVSNSNTNSSEPIIYDWHPPEHLDVCKSTWISIMQLLDEAKTPRHYQRQLIHVLNNNLLAHITEGPFADKHFQSPDNYRRMVQKNTKTTIKFDICPNGCHMYPLNDSDTKKCPIITCQAARYCNEAQVEAARDDVDRDEAMPLPELIPTMYSPMLEIPRGP